MAEIEIHAGHDHSGDTFAQRVGVAVGVIGIILAIVTIGSHRAHTQAVIDRTEENDLWSFYQARKIRQQVLDVGIELARTLASDAARAEPVIGRFTQESARQGEKTPELEKQARDKGLETAREEGRAARLDLGEGFLELGLVLSSLYFLSQRRFFPVLGITSAVIGTMLGIAGFIF